MPYERKKRSEDFMRAHGIPVNESLPPIISENEADIKSCRKIMIRAAAAYLTAMAAFGINDGRGIKFSISLMEGYIKAFGLEDALTAEEKKLFELGNRIIPLKPQKMYLTYIIMRIERSMPLLWSCGILNGDFYFPSGVNDDEQSKRLEIISDSDRFGQLMAKAELRPLSEILDAADLTYRLYAACRDASAKGEKLPEEFDEIILSEHDMGFNWIIRDIDWDKAENTP